MDGRVTERKLHVVLLLCLSGKTNKQKTKQKQKHQINKTKQKITNNNQIMNTNQKQQNKKQPRKSVYTDN